MATERTILEGYEAFEALLDACAGQVPQSAIDSARDSGYKDSDEGGVDWALNALIEFGGTVPPRVVAMLREEYDGGFIYDADRLEQLLGLLGVGLPIL